MLFDFGEAAAVGMWMKNTYISLDMIFIRADGTVAAVARRHRAAFAEVIGSEEPVRAVLEVVAGTAGRIGLKPGDTVHHRIFKHRRMTAEPCRGRGVPRLFTGPHGQRGVAQSGSAPALGAGGRQFESGHPDHADE